MIKASWFIGIPGLVLAISAAVMSESGNKGWLTSAMGITGVTLFVLAVVLVKIARRMGQE